MKNMKKFIENIITKVYKEKRCVNTELVSKLQTVAKRVILFYIDRSSHKICSGGKVFRKFQNNCPLLKI